MAAAGKRGAGLTPAKAYLALYNLAQFGLWAAILVLTARQVVQALLAGKATKAGVEGVWPAVGPLVKLAVGECRDAGGRESEPTNRMHFNDRRVPFTRQSRRRVAGAGACAAGSLPWGRLVRLLAGTSSR